MKAAGLPDLIAVYLKEHNEFLSTMDTKIISLDINDDILSDARFYNRNTSALLIYVSDESNTQTPPIRFCLYHLSAS